jgi:uncharacterized membrane protein YozB (DUF420 family)
MPEIRDLPILNAVLNGSSTLLLLAGYYCIRQKNKSAHRLFMISALVTSSLFLCSYLVYHASVGSMRFHGQGWVRPLYFVILTSHTIFAVLLPVLVIVTLTRALRKRFPEHRLIARWTLPIWLYVSVTGVLIYLMLYRLF